MRTRPWIAAAATLGLLLTGCDEPGSPPADEVHDDQQMPPDEAGDEVTDRPAEADDPAG
ncbi:hypothetical protein [Egicoccus halophilus]|uniref:hypothetical protein n=1 Tax=Egicoccus halophilus TaxID=1670830 RepID=UPI0013EE8A34|nr:hypothetical protein [Egicoccus halophilus]